MKNIKIFDQVHNVYIDHNIEICTVNEGLDVIGDEVCFKNKCLNYEYSVIVSSDQSFLY